MQGCTCHSQKSGHLALGVKVNEVAITRQDPFGLMGQPTFVSVGMMVLSISFAMCAAMGLYTSVTERQTEMNRVAYWHSSLSSFVHLIVAIYLLWFGIIGVMVWT